MQFLMNMCHKILHKVRCNCPKIYFDFTGSYLVPLSGFFSYMNPRKPIFILSTLLTPLQSIQKTVSWLYCRKTNMDGGREKKVALCHLRGVAKATAETEQEERKKDRSPARDPKIGAREVKVLIYRVERSM